MSIQKNRSEVNLVLGKICICLQTAWTSLPVFLTELHVHCSPCTTSSQAQQRQEMATAAKVWHTRYLRVFSTTLFFSISFPLRCSVRSFFTSSMTGSSICSNLPWQQLLWAQCIAGRFDSFEYTHLNVLGFFHCIHVMNSSPTQKKESKKVAGIEELRTDKVVLVQSQLQQFQEPTENPLNIVCAATRRPTW